MASHGLVFSICLFLPEGDAEATEICFAHRFAYAVAIRAGIFYYGSLSVYSYFGVLNNFDQKKYLWCEKWIHFCVHAISFLCYFYNLAVLEKFSCEQSSNYTRHNTTFWYVIKLSFLLTPTFFMIALYYKVKKREQSEQEQPQTQPVCVIRAREIAWQSCVYLFLLYVAMVPIMVMREIEKKKNNDRSELRQKCSLFYSFFFFCTMLVYQYFSTDFCTACSKKEVHFNTEEFSGTTTPPGETLPPRIARSSAAALRQSSFNIFDGTNATGGFSEFVHGGDSDDEEADNNETKHWNTIQDHV